MITFFDAFHDLYLAIQEFWILKHSMITTKICIAYSLIDFCHLQHNSLKFSISFKWKIEIYYETSRPMNHEAANKDIIYYKQNVIFLVSLKITCQLCILNTFCGLLFSTKLHKRKLTDDNIIDKKLELQFP